jgi:hypothetical protein
MLRRLIGPSNSQGAVIRSHRRAATNVSVFQWPYGTLSTRRSPTPQRPWVRVMLVLAQVSSMNTSRPALGLPLPNRRLIALHGTFRRPLAGEAQPLEQPPYAGLAVALTGERLDQLANPSQGPQTRAWCTTQAAPHLQL